ncbi:MAG TPA: Mut7-C RNAse domain-containing protein [Anaeromyxobacteraceae bacterium]|nr:Mut7-C RNAse domain-containing protein [Anaeromyxobacteraceae bacterium]
MSRATFRFYAELNDLLAPWRRGVPFPRDFNGAPAVKDVIESLGVPHTEVDLILADGESVDFSWTLKDGARVSVYPVFEALDIAPLTRVRPEPLRTVRFVLDGHLGRLARRLRMLGFDALWWRDPGDEEIARVAAAEHRIVLTRDSGLLKRRVVTHGYRVREVDPRRQLAEVVRRLDLLRSAVPLSRCLCCNALLETAPKEEVASALPPRVRERHEEFRRCPVCRRVYWPGSHRQRMEQVIASLGRRAGDAFPGARP